MAQTRRRCFLIKWRAAPFGCPLDRLPGAFSNTKTQQKSGDLALLPCQLPTASIHKSRQSCADRCAAPTPKMIHFGFML